MQEMGKVGCFKLSYRMRMGRNLSIWIVAGVLASILGASASVAGWRIEGDRFALSVHSDLTCVECHSDIEALSRHPESANVTRKMADFFSAEKCFECHDDVQGQIARLQKCAILALTPATAKSRAPLPPASGPLSR